MTAVTGLRPWERDLLSSCDFLLAVPVSARSLELQPRVALATRTTV
jgi:hypothetical protein